jgi:hypothetical protein
MVAVCGFASQCDRGAGCFRSSETKPGTVGSTVGAESQDDGYAPFGQIGAAVADVTPQRGRAWTNDAPERHINPREAARDTASMRVLTASFEKMRLTCDFTVSGEISKVRAMCLLAKP